jgi:phosphoribosylformylglycinamidine synthase
MTVVGKFTKSGKLHVFYGQETVAYLDMEFLHDGYPQMKLTAVWKRKQFPEPSLPDVPAVDLLMSLLSSPNIATKESVVRQYDHEVKGMSVVKPFMLGPSDAGVIRPLLSGEEGVVVAHGMCPKYVHDSYDMAACALDEAIRNAIAAGAKFGYLAALDNFSWPDPIQSEKTPDGELKLGDLVRSCISLYDNTIAYGVPLISGKDSMKNDFYSGTTKYSIPPTLLVTVIGKMDDVNRACTTEFKQPGDHIYVLGKTRDELGGSELFRLFGAVGNSNPKVRTNETIPLYRALSQAIAEGLVASAHDVSDGGLAVAIAESAFPAGNGVDIDIGLIQRDTEKDLAMLFSESAGRFVVSVAEKHVAAFEKLMDGKPCAKVGRVRGDRRFILRKGPDNMLVNTDVNDLKNAWNTPRY